MSQPTEYVRAWNEGADLSKILDGKTKDFMVEYAKVDPRRLEDHIKHVAKKAWEIEDYPCFQKFMFLHFDLYRSQSYQYVLDQVKAGNLFLDLGCGLGQDMRRLVFDGAPSEKLIGLELRQSFVDLGYELFQDRSSLKSHFLFQSFFEDTPEINRIAKTVKVINSGYFMHMWDCAKQVEIAKRMIHLLSSAKGSIITGVHFGSRSSGKWKSAKNKEMFLHNSDTLNELWQQCARDTATSWDVRCVVEDDEYCRDLDPEACHLRWVAERL
ncbi:hypothetical protein N7486_006224 [Penicillium sp. IBT 16267x]|nr:hypothetical protein N7486_006224 [Penicillium sp. IBT 16267x]